MTEERIEAIRRAHYGFITKEELARIVEIDRLFPLLVRCGGCRFTAPAQDVEKLIGYVENAGDYVRDVSFPAGGEV